MFLVDVYVVICLAFFAVYYLSVSFIGLITSDGEEELIFLLTINRNFVVSFRKVLFRIGCAVLLWNSLGLPYN